MSETKHTCPTCGRRLSERHVHWDKRCDRFDSCPDPCHDLADEAPALLEALEALVARVDLDTTPLHVLKDAEAVLATARGQEVPK